MCDLIDLDNSTGTSLNTKLASPLIPVPSSIEQRNLNICCDRNNTLIIEKRESLGNNPFDMLLHKAIEYVNKEEDPFEIVYEKALKGTDIAVLENKSINIIDDFKSTYTQFSCELKEGKVLDESFSNPDLKKSTAEIKSLNSSILNHSAMNDTLYDTNYNREENEMKCMVQHKVPLHIQETERDMKNLIPINIKSIQMRSYSQGDIIHECKQLLKYRSNSATETLKTDGININDTEGKSSSIFNDQLNKGFLEDQYNDVSVFSTISNISSITRNSGSLTQNSMASMVSNNTMNFAFLDNYSSLVFCDTKLNERVNSTMSKVSVSSGTSLPITPAQKQIDISVLAQKLNELKLKTSELQVSQKDNNESDNQHINTRATFDVDDKLLDIDVCLPEITFSKLSNNNINSDASSDSNFLKNNNVNKSILNEAKALAKTFEEYAEKALGSNSDELIIDDPMWTSELLPAFEDDIVDDLIEVPSLNVNNREEKIGDMLCSNDKTKSQNNITKNIEIVPFSQIIADKKATSTLLLDLKKIVTTENNSEANRLLENLEKVLGIQSSNIELLSAYLQTTNDSENIKNTKEEEHNKSHVDDLKIHENKELCCNNKINSREVLNDSKQLLIKENKIQNDLSLVNTQTEISPKKERSVDIEKKENDVDINNSTRENIETNNDENNKTENNEKVAVELLINLGKVLSGQSNESATLNLLKNLGEVLNLVSKNKQEKNNEQDNIISTNIGRTSTKEKSGNKVQSTISLKVKQRRSLDLISKMKPSNQKALRRSTCITSASPNKKLQNSLILKDNNKSQLSKSKKRFPSDPGSINLVSFKKEVAANIGDQQIINTQKIHTEINNPKEKPPIKFVVKNQLKNKSKFEVVNKKGPMKAIIPIGNMHRKSITTPPKSPKNVQPCIKIFSSTPNSMENEIEFKKSPKLKPMASSTPDSLKHKSVVQLPMLQRCDKINASCDISPINVQEEITTDKCKVYLSPKRVNKCCSPRRGTPKSQIKESSIPKYSTSPGILVRVPSQDINKSQEMSISSQILSKKEENIYKKSPMTSKKIGITELKSPLKDSNHIVTKGKPLNLTSKLRRSNNKINGSEKENTFS
ncbi:protein PF14_0175-like isoform X1 [Vespa crabro]|uniref:protein PF14_0175-like isoform X1 n=1 Tax=Vespa crabro TaxID=7445 RepID=UPI001EFFFAF8|nr:protein PF14_0175-like isoform X1 [Vespa crabro]